jgi:hypothetical protein
MEICFSWGHTNPILSWEIVGASSSKSVLSGKPRNLVVDEDALALTLSHCGSSGDLPPRRQKGSLDAAGRIFIGRGAELGMMSAWIYSVSSGGDKRLGA